MRVSSPRNPCPASRHGQRPHLGTHWPERLGLDLKGWVGADANGYGFGPAMLSATEDGKWVSYVYNNPESGGIGSDFGGLWLKNVWVERRDGPLFASGWYIDADAFTEHLVSVARYDGYLFSSGWSRDE